MITMSHFNWSFHICDSKLHGCVMPVYYAMKESVQLIAMAVGTS